MRDTIIFDLFGTLAYRRVKTNFLSKIVQRIPDHPALMDRQCTVNTLMSTNKFTDVRSALSVIGIDPVDVGEEAIKEAQQLLDIDVASLTLYPDSIEALSMAKAAKMRIFLLSNLATPYVQRFYIQGIDHFFEKCFMSCETGLLKPQIEAFKQVPVSAITTRDVFMVGNSQHDDVDGANSAGFTGVLLSGSISETVRNIIKNL